MMRPMNRPSFSQSLVTNSARLALGSLVAIAACSPHSPALMKTSAQAQSLQTPNPPSAHGVSSAGSPSSKVAQPKPAPVDIAPAIHAAAPLVDAALTGAGERVAGWWAPLAAQPDYHVLLDPARTFTRPLSIGVVDAGTLLNAAQLEVEGEFHSVIERHRARHTQFATPALIAAIKDAARRVSEVLPGPKLRVGNMSVKGGGRIRWSRSHRTGRDADLAFYCLNKKTGEPVLAPDLLTFDARGQARERPDLVFDTARNWQLAKALLEHPTVDVQWLFLSIPLKDMLLRHAEEIGEDPELIARAAQVMQQPSHSLPHDDHFHLRITCPEADRLEGCLDMGPRWEWVNWHTTALQARSLALAKAFDAPDTATRIAALDLLQRIHSPFAPELALMAARRETDPVVREHALKVATSVPPGSLGAIVQAMRFVDEPNVVLSEKTVAYQILRRSVDPLALDTLKTRAIDPQLDLAERVLAANAMIHYMTPDLVPYLIEQMKSQPAEVAAQFAVTLRRITNHSQGLDWQALARTQDADKRQQTMQAWDDWWQKNQAFTREEWVQKGFQSHGLGPSGAPLDMRAVGTLIAMLTTAPDYVVYNANQQLAQITGRWAPLEAWDNKRLHAYWTKWWSWWRKYHPDHLAMLSR